MVFASIVACKKDTRPNYQFMPNMYEPVPYEAYQDSDAFKGDMEAQLPADGSIPRGDHMPFEIENTIEGYDLAKASLMNPLDSTQIDSKRAGALYDIYCGICHGKQGKGDGQLGLGKRELILPGSYADKDISAGSIYHTIYYGKNLMGSYANQLNEEERWQVVDYVLKLKADLDK